jgi:hypothetical protein
MTESTSTVSPPLNPLLIPINMPDSDLAEWSMIELNGELIMPQTSDADQVSEENSLIPPDHVELGSLRFVNEASNSSTLLCTLL